MAVELNLGLLKFSLHSEDIAKISSSVLSGALQLDLRKLSNDLTSAGRLHFEAVECYNRFANAHNGIVRRSTDKVEGQLGTDSTKALSSYCCLVREDLRATKEHHDAFTTIYDKCQTLCFNGVNEAHRLAQVAERRGKIFDTIRFVGKTGGVGIAVTACTCMALGAAGWVTVPLGASALLASGGCGIAIAAGSHFLLGPSAILYHELQRSCFDLNRQFKSYYGSIDGMRKDITILYGLESTIKKLEILLEKNDAAIEFIRDEYERLNSARQQLVEKTPRPIPEELSSTFEEALPTTQLQ